IRAYYRKGSWPSRVMFPESITEPVMADHAWARHAQQQEHIQPGSIAIPFYHETKLFCILMAKPAEITADTEQDILKEAENLHIQLYFGIERAKLYHDIEIRSVMDGLTRVYRRQYFDVTLEEETQRAESFQTVYGLVMLDIDHFKNINDSYGHQMGDEVLARLGIVLKTFFYETDFVARYGGEEFVIICPRADREGLLRRLENLRAKISAEKFWYNQKEIAITVSMGMALFPRNGSHAKSVLSAADQALYEAKNNGRNRIEVAS
ncbi:MAG: diguanylate cyclase, partial [Elusimicrobia bacterium]|nr:diguanylate cyclase [Elusimicrobiota bacterium]MBD3412514.1 diguanylate cyclase [Elusimicrobiota bacterium]